MTITSEVQEIFRDADAMYGSAMYQLVQGDIRDAAEKAWCATLRATDALILSRTGEAPERTPQTSRALRELRKQDSSVGSLVSRYYERMGTLHGDCFYLGLCEPESDVEDLVRQTMDYIRDAKEMANQP